MKPNFAKGFRSKRILQNASWLSDVAKPTIRIAEGETLWANAYTNWLQNKPPTTSEEWRAGVFLHFEPIIEPETPAKHKPVTMLSYVVLGGKMLISSIFIFILWFFTYVVFNNDFE